MSDNLLSFICDGTPQAVIDRYASLSAAAKASGYGELDRNIVVIDTETTGFSFNHDELTQIAAARMNRGEIVDWYVTFVNPGKPIPEDVAHLTNIHDEDVADAPSPDEALAGLARFTGNSMIVAHNSNFDRTFTTRHPSGYPLLENIWIDSLDLSRIALPRLKSHRLIDLVKAFGAPVSTHRADDDVAATCAIFRVLLAAVDAMPKPLVAKIASLATKEEWQTQVVFDYFANHADDVSRETFDDAASSIEGESSFEDEQSGQLGWATSALDLYSLRSLRRERLRAVENRVKIDADAIAADPMRDLAYPSSGIIESAFSENGVVGGLYQDYEPRQGQRLMSLAVREAAECNENLVVEAGTGVGKSMAYLVPLAYIAKDNGITVGVATKTNALLDQLVYKEIPALSDALLKKYPDSEPLTCAPLKGFSHYPCLRKIDSVVEDGARILEVQGRMQSQAAAMGSLLSFIEQTEYDDIDGLKIDYRLLSRKVITTSSQECLRRKCPYFGSTCFVHGSRKRAESADILVTNHSLLFCNVAAEGGLLPPIRYWAVDEAHGAEQEARRALSVALDSDEILRCVRKVSPEDSKRNVFMRAERRVSIDGRTISTKAFDEGYKRLIGDAGLDGGEQMEGSQQGETLFYALTAKAKAAGEAYVQCAEPYCSSVKGLLFFESGNRGKGYDTTELWINDDIRKSATFADVREKGVAFRQTAERLAAACQNLVAFLDDIEGAAAVQGEISSLCLDLKSQVNAIDLILTMPTDSYAYSATLSKKKDRFNDRLEALPMNVGEKLNDTLYASTHSVVYASATLSVNGRFDTFANAMGLGQGEFSSFNTLQLDSSYDFDKNMTVYVANDIPEPNSPSYVNELQRFLTQVHLAQGGSMLTLFTNRREMERCFEYVQPELKKEDLRLVCQKWGVSVKGLRDDFLKDETLSLFALKSFWEGFDAPGSTLRGVVIPKLPFSKPSDPLSCERGARDDQAWRHYVLPAAVLEVKQAAGRLIRKADDSGVLILADRRLVSKGYGKVFLNSLPSKSIKILPMKQIVEEISSMNRGRG